MKLSEKINELIQQHSINYTSVDNGHRHEYEIDANGNGSTTFTHGAEEHTHKIKENIVQKEDGHKHEIEKVKVNEE